MRQSLCTPRPYFHIQCTAYFKNLDNLRNLKKAKPKNLTVFKKETYFLPALCCSQTGSFNSCLQLRVNIIFPLSVVYGIMGGCLFIYMYSCMYTYAFIQECVYMYVLCMHVCVICVCIYVCMYHTCMHDVCIQ